MVKKICIAVLLGTSLLVNADKLTYTVKSGDYSVTLSPHINQTMRSITYKDQQLASPKGFYNLGIGEKSGGYCGAGHTEGGAEEIISFKLTCDGSEIEPTVGQTYTGRKIVADKVSKLQNTVFRTRFEITPYGILEQKRFIAVGEQKFFYLVINMYCFNPNTTDFIAENSAGKIVSGKFDGDFPEKSRWHLGSDVKFAAIYEEKSQKGILIYYPEIIKGKDRKCSFWEVKKAYNKYYHMADHPPVSNGFESKTYSVFLKGFESPSEKLQETVQDLNSELKSQSFPELALPEYKKTTKE